MPKLDCIIVYVKVNGKTVPEIFYDAEEAKEFLDLTRNPDFFDAVDMAVKTEQLKVEA